ncbi:MAG: AAA domain-containing protein [Chloroflexia bacterium]|nr:AAA domain-containing protein [Chloroflexia bacterium]
MKKIEESLQLILEEAVDLKHPNPNVINVNAEELAEEIEMALMDPEGTSLMIWGAPGIGKTKIVSSVLEAASKPGQPIMRLIDVATPNMAPDDWALPAVKEMETGWQAMDIPKNWLPVWTPTGDPEEDAKRNDAANMGNGGILFFDELSRASSAVQNTCLKLIDERKIGQSRLGDKWVMIAASNREGDDPTSEINFSTALGNRFSQINFVPDFDSWKQWAHGKVDQRILDFLEFNRDDFYTLDDEDESGIFASPRSWAAASESLSRQMQYAKDKGVPLTAKRLTRAIGKNIGKGIAERLAAFLKLMETWSPADLRQVFTDPGKARLPKKAGTGYDLAESAAVLSMLVTTTKDRELTPRRICPISRNILLG